MTDDADADDDEDDVDPGPLRNAAAAVDGASTVFDGRHERSDQIREDMRHTRYIIVAIILTQGVESSGYKYIEGIGGGGGGRGM